MIEEIKLHDATDDLLDGFGVDPNPENYETHELLDDSIRGPKGATVQIHKNDLAVLRRNGLIAPGAEQADEPKAEPAKKGKKAQSKAEQAAPVAQPKAEQADEPDPIAEALKLAESIADQPAAGV